MPPRPESTRPGASPGRGFVAPCGPIPPTGEALGPAIPALMPGRRGGVPALVRPPWTIRGRVVTSEVTNRGEADHPGRGGSSLPWGGGPTTTPQVFRANPDAFRARPRAQPATLPSASAIHPLPRRPPGPDGITAGSRWRSGSRGFPEFESGPGPATVTWTGGKHQGGPGIRFSALADSPQMRGPPAQALSGAEPARGGPGG